jgi:hypothetical protein
MYYYFTVVSWSGAFSQERQVLWLSQDDLKDPSSWSSSPLLFLRDIHSKFLFDYNSKESSSQSEFDVGGSGGLTSQDGVSQPEETAPLSLPHLNRLFETSFVWDFPDSQGRPPAQYPHNVDPCFSHVLLCLYVLCGKGQPVDQPPSHEPF